MELTESIQSLNNQLINLFGIDTISGQAIWRIVWSEDQFEKRMMDVTDEGLSLLYPEIRLVPKYRQWITEKYVLERLVLVPEVNNKELGGLKQSYEPLFTFEDKNGNYLPPNIIAAKFVIDTVYAAQGKSTLAKYKDPESNQEEALEIKKRRIDELQEAIFGDETDVTDALTRQEAIVVPNNYNKEN